MPYKNPHDPVNREKRNARKRVLRRLQAAKHVGDRRLYNPGPFKYQAPEVKTLPPPAAPLTWIDRAQVAAYGYSGSLKLSHF